MSDREQGFEALQKGDPAAAIPFLESATQADQNDYQAFLYLGAAYAKVNRFQDAVNVLNRAVELQPSNPQARYNYGVALQRAGWLQEAHTVLQQALTLQPEYPQAQQALAQVHQALAQQQAPAAPNMAMTMPLPSMEALLQGQPQLGNQQNPYAPQPQNPYAPQPQAFVQPNYQNLLAFQNNSGTKGDVPPEVAACRWNWGAFFFTSFWLMFHGQPLAGVILLLGPGLLSVIPGLGTISAIASLAGLIASIYFGVTGHKFAWKNRRYNDINHFFEVERKWSIAVLIMFACSFALAFLLFFVIFKTMGRG